MTKHFPLLVSFITGRDDLLDRLHHNLTAGSLNNLGYLLQVMGELAQAQRYYEQALAIFEAKLGPDHPHTKIVRGNLRSIP